ncbi:MAG: hypothetical protein ACKPB4_02355, partial [Sphaerospermopsis kisseleviana]
MYATDLEMKHPLCQVLLLDHSIKHFCLYFLTFGPSLNHILKFTKYVQESGQMGLLGGILTRDDLTLTFFFENNILSDVISKHFSPHQVIGLEKGKGSAQLPSSSLGRSESTLSKKAVAHVVPSVTEEKYQQLRCQLLKIMRQLQPYGIFRVLEESPSKNKDKQSSYNKKCVEFCNKKFDDVGSTYKIYLTKMVAYSGLLIHDIVRVGHSKNLN